jgi:hypothetical protein
MADDPIVPAPHPARQQWIYRTADGLLMRGGYGRQSFDPTTEAEAFSDVYVDPFGRGLTTIDELHDAIADAEAARDAALAREPPPERTP